MEIINNYIKWLNKNSTQYEVEEINEEDRALYLRKYKEDFGVFKFCLYCLIPIYGIIRGIYRSQTEYGQFEYVVGVGFDENGKVTFVTKGEDEEFLKKKYNINKSIDRFLEKIHIL